MVYYPNTSLLDAQLGTSPSQVWRGIVEGRDTLKLALPKRIGSGEDTMIWTDNWLPREYKMRPVAAKTVDPPLVFSELIDSVNGVWNETLLEDHFYEMDKEDISRIPLSSKKQPDFWAWQYEMKGVSSVRSTYRMLVNIKKIKRRLD